PVADVDPAPELLADFGQVRDPGEPQRLVEGGAGRVRQRGAADDHVQAARAQQVEQLLVQASTETATDRPRRQVDGGFDAVAVGGAGPPAGRVRIAEHGAGFVDGDQPGQAVALYGRDPVAHLACGNRIEFERDDRLLDVVVVD